MKNLRNRFDRFCYRNQHKGIPNLMLFIVLGNAVVYLMSMLDNSNILYYTLCFNKTLILQGQIWRLFTYVFTGAFQYGNILFVLVFSFCYFSLGRSIEQAWGTLRFNLFYLTGVILMDIYAMIFGVPADPYYLNLSLFLSFATLYPDAQFLLFFIIPIKAWVFALVDIVLLLVGLFLYPFPFNMFPVIALANYFLFFGPDVIRVIPYSWQVKLGRIFKKKSKQPKQTYPGQQKPIQFRPSNATKTPTPKAKPDYLHRCTICGRTDVSDPDLEFRYCSRCNGYHCYCQDHINNHTHIE